MKINIKKGLTFAILASLISGFSVFLNKFAVGAVQPPLLFTATKNMAVGLLILAVIILTRKLSLLKKLNRREVFGLLLIGLIGGSLPFYLYFTGLSVASAVNAALIQKTLVIWVTLLAVPLLKEKLNRLTVAAVLFLFSANFIIGGFNGLKFSSGELFIFAATLLWAVETVIAKKVLQTVDVSLVLAARMLFGAIVLLVAAFITVPGALGKINALSVGQLGWLLLTALLLLGYVVTWYRALKYSSVISVTAILVSATLITNLLSAAFITHSWDVTLTIQGVFMVLGVGLLTLGWSKKPNFVPRVALKS